MADIGAREQLGSWDEYGRLILKALDKIDDGMTSMNSKIDRHNGDRSKEISDLQIQVGMLKVQATAWAAVASTFVSIAVGLIVKNWGH